MSRPKDNPPSLGLEQKQVLEERLLSLQYIHLGNIDSFIGGRCEKFHLTQREHQGLSDFIEQDTSSFMNHELNTLNAKREYIAVELVYTFVARLLGVDLSEKYEDFRQVLSRKPYNIPKEQKPLFYRGEGVSSQARKIGIEAEDVMQEEFEKHRLKVRTHLVDDLQKEVMQTKSRVEAGNFTERDYYHVLSIIITDRLFNLNLDKRCEDVWKALEKHFGVFAIDIPECFREKTAA